MLSTTEQSGVAPLVKYSVTDAEIATLRTRFNHLTVDTPDGYEEVRLAISELRDLRGAVERRRVELKADALAYGRAVDTEAKRITGHLREIEGPLQSQKDYVDAEKERRKQEAIEAKRREVEAQIRAEREAEEARLRAERQAEEARLAVERARLEEERRVLEAQRREAAAAEAVRVERERAAQAAENARIKAEQQKLEAERRVIQQERERTERLEFERQAKIRAEEAATIKAEQDRLARLQREAEIAALKPDIERIRDFAAAIRALSAPKVRAKKAASIVADALTALGQVAAEIELKVGRL